MKRHEADIFSLIAGLTFSGIAIVYLIAALNDQSVNGRIVIPVALIALGIAGLAGAVARVARRSRRTSAAVPSVAGPGAGTAGSPLSDLAQDLEAMGLLDDDPPRPPRR